MKEIPISRGYIAMVDDEDYDRLIAFKWNSQIHRRASGVVCVYAVTVPPGSGKTVYMHRLLLDGSKEVDHRDGDGLNNSRSNLRACTRSQNNLNGAKRKNTASRWKGVTWHEPYQKWRTRLAGRFVGYFREQHDAAQAYNFAVLEQWGEFARFNEVTQ